MTAILKYLQSLSTTQLSLLFLVENILVCLGSLALGWLISTRYKIAYSPITAKEYIFSLLTILINTIITYAGFYLWQRAIIKFGLNWSWGIIPQFIILFMAMDLLMFVFHFAIHFPFLYKRMHKLHHQFQNPSPIDLYVLHPVETVGFGTLWLALICLYPFNIYAVIIYLIVNVVFGIVGHLGFEPLPKYVKQLPVIKYLGNSAFHHTHHTDIKYNFGFYTILWDKLFGTYK